MTLAARYGRAFGMKLLNRLGQRLARRTKRRGKRAERERIDRALREIALYPRYARPRPHGLPAELIVSLTSYPKRYGTLDRTLKSLLDQTVRPDRLILWVADDHRAALPKSVTELRSETFEIRTRKARVRVANDGELMHLTSPLRYRSKPGALRVMVPRGVPTAFDTRA